MRTRIALLTGLLTLAGSAAALALENPIVAKLHPVGNSGITGSVTFMQLGKNVNVGVELEKDVTNAAVDVRRGSCSALSDERFPLVPVNGKSGETRLSTTLQELDGNVIVVHKTKDTKSPAIACGQIKG